MTRRLHLALLLAGLLSLNGCVAGMAVSAAGMAARSARGEPASNEHLRPTAITACSAEAARHGTVTIIDSEQRTPSKIVVWGTADDGKQRRSFECAFGTKITSMKYRMLAPKS